MDLKNQIFRRVVFAYVAELRSFTKTAKRLCISQAVVSKYVAGLEQEIGVSLIHRTTRRLSLTDHGQMVASLFMPIIERIDEANQVIEGVNKFELTGSFKLTCSESTAQVAERAAITLSQKHPHLKVHIIKDDMRINLIQGGIDAAISVGTLQDSSLKAKRVGKMEEVIVAPTNLAYGGNFQKDFLDLPYINNSWEQNYIDFIHNKKSIRLKKNIKYRVNSLSTIKQFILSGLAIARVPLYYVQEELKRGLLIIINQGYSIPRAEVNLVHPYHLESKKINLFYEEFSKIWGSLNTKNH